MRGQFLYPLNELKLKYPGVYANEAQKYCERQFIMTRQIPYLNCLWNDVLHLTAVAPTDLANAFASAGLPFCKEFYSFDAELIEPDRAIIYLNLGSQNLNKVDPDNFRPYDKASLRKYARVPEDTITYYRRMHADGQVPLTFHGIPHILYRGRLSVRDAGKVIAQSGANANG